MNNPINNKFRRKLLVTSLMAVSASFALPTLAQSTSGAMALEEIVVTARRREETIQDVPISVNAVTGEQLSELNIRSFEDLEGVVAGLTLDENSIAPNASVRGVRFDTFTGTSPTVEFYLNDTPGTPLTLMQAMFDVGQIEVLRGPQGTLRGKASPSGSITVTSQRPDLGEFGGYVDTTATDLDGKNVKAALNVPIIQDMLAVRVAGFWEENDANLVENAFSGEAAGYKGNGYRLSVGYEPLDTLSVNLMYQMLKPERTDFAQVESANIADPSLAASDRFIDDGDLLSVQDMAHVAEQELEATTLNIAWDINEQHQLNYAGAYIDEIINRVQSSDVTNAIDGSFPTGMQGHAQTLTTNSEGYSHELRLQSTEPLFDKVDYVVGALYSISRGGTNLINDTPIRIDFQAFPGFVVPGVAGLNFPTPIYVRNDPEETSFFANLTYHLADSTEISAGVREVDINFTNLLTVGGGILTNTEDNFGDTIFMASLKHDFTEDLMGYISYGESFRRGVAAVGDFSLVKSATQDMFTNLDPETSDSIEIGLKSSWLEDRLRVNASAFRQEFDNYPYRSATPIYYANYAFGGFDPNTGAPIVNPTVGTFNFVAAVPVIVNGIEVEATFAATENLNVGALMSYAKGEIDDGIIPCNDYLPNDGIADSNGAVPSLGDIFAAAGGQNLTQCLSSDRSNNAPLWTTTLTSEYTFQVGDMDAYVRGLWTFYGDSETDPTNNLDDVSSYDILNLYTGLRDPEGSWEAMIFVKNVLDADEVLSRNAAPGSVGYQISVIDATQSPIGGGPATAISDYREISVTAPREIGINFRYNF